MNRVVPDIAFVAGLPARILAARLASESGGIVPMVIATLAGAVRRGCDSPEALANAVHLGHETSRVGSRRAFEKIRRLILPSDEGELFETTLERVRAGHMRAMFEED